MFLGPRDIVKRRGYETAANGRADCYKMVHEGVRHNGSEALQTIPGSLWLGLDLVE
jgi:hypothetical protein